MDYYCKVWLNGVYLGSHEGYSAPFSFSLDEAVQRNGKNRLIVKVWSPWDDEVAANLTPRNFSEFIKGKLQAQKKRRAALFSEIRSYLLPGMLKR